MEGLFGVLRELVWHDEMEDEVKDDAVHVRNEDDAENTGKDAEKFNFVVAGYATCKIVGDSLVKFYYECTGYQDSDPAQAPAPIECPMHKHIVSCIGSALHIFMEFSKIISSRGYSSAG